MNKEIYYSITLGREIENPTASEILELEVVKATYLHTYGYFRQGQLNHSQIEKYLVNDKGPIIQNIQGLKLYRTFMFDSPIATLSEDSDYTEVETHLVYPDIFQELDEFLTKKDKKFKRIYHAGGYIYVQPEDSIPILYLLSPDRVGERRYFRMNLPK